MAFGDGGEPAPATAKYTRGRSRVPGLSAMDEVRIAVIGAGVAGLTCARELARADAASPCSSVRAAWAGGSARGASGNLAFDHGAQFVTARSRPFIKYVEVAARAGVLMPLAPRILEDDRSWDAPIEEWLVGVPGMSAACGRCRAPSSCRPASACTS